VLVFEDQPTIGLLRAHWLHDAGYPTNTAPEGAAGLRILQSSVRVDLLVTDVGLPGGMNGRQVADASRVARPNLKILFITGYAENAAVGNGHLDHGMEILTKPFEITALAKKVRAMTGA
jgi:CheY-like chemotaxis protein